MSSASVIEQIATEHVGAAIASHVAPGAPLAVMAMVCCGWWKGARKLQASRDYDIVWADHALQRQLATLLRRLPELEPDLRSPELAAAGGGGDGAHRYDEAMARLAIVCGAAGVHYEGAPAIPRNRIMIRDALQGITSAAIQRMARCDLGADVDWTGMIPGTPSPPEFMLDKARGVIDTFLHSIVYTTVVYTEQERCDDITGMHVARALQLHGRPLPDTGAVLSGPFEGRKQYLHAFSRLVGEYLQDMKNGRLATTRVADVLLRRATEEYVADVVTTARQSAADAGCPQLIVLKHASEQCFERVMVARHCVHSEPLPGDVVDDDDESDDGGPDAAACEQQTEQENEDDAYEDPDDDTDDRGPYHLDEDLWQDDVNTSSWWDNIDRSARCQAELHWEDLCKCFSAVPPRSWRRFAEEALAGRLPWWAY